MTRYVRGSLGWTLGQAVLDPDGGGRGPASSPTASLEERVARQAEVIGRLLELLLRSGALDGAGVREALLLDLSRADAEIPAVVELSDRPDD